MDTKKTPNQVTEKDILGSSGNTMGQSLANSMVDAKPNLDCPNMEGDISIETVIKDIGNDMKSSCLQWLQPMKENEQFELMSPNQVDKLLEEAKALEAHLLQEKDQLLSRLQLLSRSLQVTT